MGRCFARSPQRTLPPGRSARNYFCPNVRDIIYGKPNRDYTLIRWAAHLQNDFRARLDWCVKDYASANHPPIPSITGGLHRSAKPGETIELDASASRDPDGQPLKFEWLFYPESTGYIAVPPKLADASASKSNVVLPADSEGKSLHFTAIVSDTGAPPLTRYAGDRGREGRLHDPIVEAVRSCPAR